MARASTRRREGGGTMLLGIIAGALVGAAVGLAYAPGAGERNRQRIAEWLNSRTEDVTQGVKGETGNEKRD